MTSTDQEAPLYNPIGALTFSAYVLAALFLTIRILYSLFLSYQKIIRDEAPKRTVNLEKRLQIFSALSILSFSTLSYHILSYLIISYQSWAGENTVLFSQQILGDRSLTGSEDQRGRLQVWQWLTSSALFQDFAVAICGNSAGFWWTQQALLVTMAWTVFMTFEGLLKCSSTRISLSMLNISGRKREIPHLWAYAFISQILPISFAQNLFLIAMLLKPVANPNQKIWTPTPIIQLLPLVAYYVFVLAVPFVSGTEAFVGISIVIRLLLSWPFLLPGIVPEGGGQSYLTPRKASWIDAGPFQFIGICSALLWLLQTIMTFRDHGFHVGRILGAINDSSAVSALGYDYILSLISIGVWILNVGSDIT